MEDQFLITWGSDPAVACAEEILVLEKCYCEQVDRNYTPAKEGRQEICQCIKHARAHKHTHTHQVS